MDIESSDPGPFYLRGDEVKRLKKEKRIKTKSLADLLGTTDRTITNWLAKVHRIDKADLKRLASILGVDWETLKEGYDGEVQSTRTDANVAILQLIEEYKLYVNTKGMTPEQLQSFAKRISSEIEKAIIARHGANPDLVNQWIFTVKARPE